MLGNAPADALFDEPDSSSDPSEVPTRVGKLPPEFAKPQAQPQPAPPAQPPHARAAAPAPQPAAPPRKTPRRRTLSRGEQSPLAPGRRPAAGDGQRTQPERPPGADGRGAVPPADARRPRGGQLPSEVPTEPGNDGRAGAARAAALRALALADDEVTAQRDIAVLHRLKDLAVDDLDEDTSVLPGFKLAAAGKRAAEEAASRSAQHEVTAIDRRYAIEPPPNDEDRPTPADDLSSTSSPDTSRTSTDAAPAAAMDFGRETAKYAPADAPWGTAAARARSATVENPAAAIQAAAADAVHAGAAAARRGAAPAPSAAPVAATRGVSGAAASSAAPAPATSAPVPVAAPGAAPLCAFRVAVFGPGGGAGGVRVMALAPGAPAPAGATIAMLVATTEAESAELARLFGYTG